MRQTTITSMKEMIATTVYSYITPTNGNIGLFGYFKVMVTSSNETVSREESMSGQQCKTYQLATVSWEY